MNNSWYLEPLLETVEAELNHAIKVYQNLSEDALLKRDHPDSWNIAQILWHLNSYGEFYLPLIQKCLNNNSIEFKEFKSGWLGNYFTNMMKPREEMKKIKAFKSHVPPNRPNPYEEVQIFIQQLEKLYKLLRDSNEINLNQRIPISISKIIQLKLGDVFGFIIAHNERHMKQALRCLA